MTTTTGLPSGTTIETFREADAEQRHDLWRQAFGATVAYDPAAPMPAAERTVAAYDGDRLLGTVVTHEYRQSWGGQPIGCGGVSGVIMRPEARGRGLTKAMLRESLRRMTRDGQAVAALYPTTATLYRSVGFEIVGLHETTRIDLGLVPQEPADRLDWRRVGVDDAAVRSVFASMTSRFDGWIEPDEWWWDRRGHTARLEADTSNRFVYVGARDGEDRAAVGYRYGSSENRLYELVAELVAGVDVDSVAAALGFLARNGTTAGHLETVLPKPILRAAIPNLQHITTVGDWPWMLRLVDARRAVAARGWPSSVAGSVSLDIVDDTCPGNAGPHVFEIADGAAQLTPGGAGTIRVEVTDLALVYAGGSVRTLHDAGRLPGASTTDLDVLRTACVAEPSLPFFF